MHKGSNYLLYVACLSVIVFQIERSFDLQQWESGEGLTRLYSNKNDGGGYLIVTETKIMF